MPFKDPKYGQVILESKSVIDTEPVFLLRGQDRKAPFVIDAYAQMCEESDMDPDFVRSLRVAAEQMRTWQQDHPERVKLPD